ncbi:MAG: rod shape-determining protein, partial [Corallococcus sp.]|nr:rod shape-determining protein [Corallococcus sp.]
YGENIVAGCTLYDSGRHLTQAISERVRSKYLVQLDDEQAEQLKINCSSMYSNDISNFTATGINVQNGNTESINISSKELYDTIVEFFRNYCKIIESLVNSVSDQVSNTVRQEGVFLCGGGAQLSGLDSFLHAELNMPVRVSDDPENTTIRGGLLYLENKQ